MRHPRSRAERRHNRVTIMARRRKIIRRWYSPNDIRRGSKREENRAWYWCAKWNLKCTCRLCRMWKSLDPRPPREPQCTLDIIDNLRAWDLDEGVWAAVLRFKFLDR